MAFLARQIDTYGMSRTVKTHFKMPQQRNFLREWRKYRGMTQEDIATIIGCESSSISQIETGKQWPSKAMLAGILHALNCTVVDLFTRDPNDPAPLWQIWENIPDDSKEQALKVLQTFERKSA